jgi:thiol-disulfide isomerase/thioredoxin
MIASKRRGLRTLFAFCLLALSACTASSSTMSDGSAPLPGGDPKPDGVNVGQRAYEMEGKTGDGTVIRLSGYKGKVVLLDFWAPWCVPCVEAIPHEKQIVARLAGKPFALIGVSVDGVGKHVLPWPNIVDEDANINQMWRIQAVPTFVLINPQGEIVGRWEGSQDLPKIDKAIEREVALAEKRK